MSSTETHLPKRTIETQPAEPSGEAIRTLGQVGMKQTEHTDSYPPIALEIDGVEPAHYAPAGARPYEGQVRRGLEINDGDHDAAKEYLASLFPDTDFTFVGEGRYGVVFADGNGKAYKLYRSSLRYSRSEKEAGALKLLGDQGLAPRLHLFVDAGQEYRLDRKAYDYTQFGFEDVVIPRQDSGKDLPVMVMDWVDAGPLEEADADQFADGFCKFAETFLRENIHSWDGEAMFNRQTGEVIMLDVGELYQRPKHGYADDMFDDWGEAPASRTPQAEQKDEEEIISGLCLDFGIADRYGVIKAYKTGGISAIREYLASERH